MGVNTMKCFTAFKPSQLKMTKKISWSRTTVKAQCSVRNKCSVSKVVKTASLIVTQPALALVDDRLAGEGTGKALGISDPILGWVILIVFTVVWALYYVATKDLGGQRDEDGLGL